MTTKNLAQSEHHMEGLQKMWQDYIRFINYRKLNVVEQKLLEEDLSSLFYFAWNGNPAKVAEMLEGGE